MGQTTSVFYYLPFIAGNMSNTRIILYAVAVAAAGVPFVDSVTRNLDPRIPPLGHLTSNKF